MLFSTFNPQMLIHSSKANATSLYDPRRVRDNASCRVRSGTLTSQNVKLLDAYWEARGVFDVEQRRRLVDAAAEVNTSLTLQPSIALQPNQPLPGVPATWSANGSVVEVAEVSRRLLQLQSLLGGEGVDVVWMVMREPRLLTADFTELTQQLWRLKMDSFDVGVDITKVVEAQPALLLPQGQAAAVAQAVLEEAQNHSAQLESTQEAVSSESLSSSDSALEYEYGTFHDPGRSGDTRGRQQQQQQQGQRDVDGAAVSSSGRVEPGPESAASKLQAWQYGLVSDNDSEWEKRYSQLRQYRQQYGDANVGFRDGDDTDLARWASKQRADWRRKDLPGDRIERLQSEGFEFDDDEAEWKRWFGALVSFQQQHGHSSPPPLAAGVDFYLINWCSVQRVASRTRCLPPHRIQLLDSIGFDWSGADPLS